MDYLETKNLINSMLQGRSLNHEITPSEHQTALTAVLDYIHQVAVTSCSVFQGYAKSSTFPATPDNGKLCYLALCNPGITRFSNFDSSSGVPILVNCPQNISKVVILLVWNGVYWDYVSKNLSPISPI